MRSSIIIVLLFTVLPAQELYFGKPLSPLLVAKKTFWKRVYSEIDSSRAVIFDRKTLRTFAVVKNNEVKTTVDSIKKNIRDQNCIMVKQGRKEFVYNAITRAAMYEFVSDSLAAYGLDPDLRWLPVLESGYFDTMISDQGAKGIWQFIPSTAKKYGLSPDEIADSYKSTGAFVRYFSSLNRQFNDYALALTGYHHGENGIRDKLKRNGAETLDKIIPDLGFQSGNYYAKFLSIVDIAHCVNGDTLSAAPVSK